MSSVQVCARADDAARSATASLNILRRMTAATPEVENEGFPKVVRRDEKNSRGRKRRGGERGRRAAKHSRIYPCAPRVRPAIVVVWRRLSARGESTTLSD